MSHSILIVQDDTPMRALLRTALEEQHHTVSVVAAFAEALRLVRRRNFDLVLAEFRRSTPAGLTGLGTLHRVRPGLRMVVITRYTEGGDPFQALQIPVHGCLYKPFDLATFHRVVDRALGARPPHGQHGRFLSRLVEGSRNLARRAGESLDRAHRLALEPDRDRTYQRLMQGVRSGGLGAGAALRVWDQLETLERVRQQATSATTVDWAGLRDGYRYVADLAVALGRSGSYEPVGERGPDRVPREVFAGLYGRLKRGELSLDQLKVAPLLRTAAPEALSRSPEARRLQVCLWGGDRDTGR